MKNQIKALREEIGSAEFATMPAGYKCRVYDELEKLCNLEMIVRHKAQDKVTEALRDWNDDVDAYLLESEGE